MKQGEQGCSLGSDASVAPSVAAGPTDEQLMAVPRLLAEQGASRLSFVGEWAASGLGRGVGSKGRQRAGACAWKSHARPAPPRAQPGPSLPSLPSLPSFPPPGGEPLLHPRIHELVSAAKAAGLATSMVTNASLLTPSALLRLAGSLDWLALSLDASSDALHAAVGRGVRGELAAGGSAHLRRVRQVWGQARELGFQLKLNTVVTRATL